MNRAKQSRSRVLAIMVLVMLFLGLASVTAGAAEFSLGAGVAASTSPYKSHDSQLTVSSFISYDNGRVYLRGAEAGVYLWNTGRHKVSAAVQYSWLEFDPGACDDGQMRGLEKRRSTLMAGLSYTYAAPLGQIRLGVTGDVLGRSGGFVGEAAYQHNPITLGNLTLLPGLGVSWQCREHADYYFGVS
ncbi:MAG: MipA/OmpV family protein, partial [Candidatus Adiutrix sp.]|nr:MipA/OmpV family protein [Candidatus Adiutrix sp.]